MSYANVGKVWTGDSFKEYLKTVNKPSWVRSVTLHHTAAPSLAMRPNGLIIQHIHNIKNYYQSRLGWNRGPHLFIDEDEIFGMTPLTRSGIHAASFNSTSIGIEVLGNFDVEDPLSGRGLKCWKLAALATSDLLDWIGVGISSKTILFHRDDPRTSKTCPGRKVTKDWFIDLVEEARGSSVIIENNNKPPVIEEEFQPVVEFMIKRRGVGYTAARKPLKRKGNLYFYNDHWLERAYYDVKEQQTVAPVTELEEALEALK